MARQDNVKQVFARIKSKMRGAVQSLPKVVLNEAVNFSKESFDRQGWLDQSITAWQQRKNNARAGRAILVKSGFMRRSIRVISTSQTGGVFGSDDPKARAHNYGFSGTVSVKAHSRNRFTKVKEGTGRFNVKTRKERQRTVSKLAGTGQVKSHTRRMNIPRRQFMGKSKMMNLRLSIVGRNHIMQKLK